MYNVLIEGPCHGNEMRKAVKLLKYMKRDRVTPDVRLLKMIIEAFCRLGDFSTVGPFINENVAYLKPNNVVLLYNNVILEGLINHGEVEAACQLLNSMVHGGQRVSDDDTVGVHIFIINEEVEPNFDLFNIVVSGLCETRSSFGSHKNMVGLGCKGKFLVFNDLTLELCNLDKPEAKDLASNTQKR
jgi:pentatricopeptide repeat protein